MEPAVGAPPQRREELLLLSAPDEAELAARARQLARYLAEHPEVPLPDVAAALRREDGGAAAASHRRIVVCRQRAEAIAALGGGTSPEGATTQELRTVLVDGAAPAGVGLPAGGITSPGGDALSGATARARVWAAVAGPPPPVSFLLAGVGDQYPGMARSLYAQEPVFRVQVDRCAEILQPWLQCDVREALWAAPGTAPGGAAGRVSPDEPVSAASPDRSGSSDRPGGHDKLDSPAPAAPPRPDLRQLLGRAVPPPAPPAAPSPLDRTLLLHPAIFTVEYALAQLWLSWGIAPRSLLGYSVGEYVAACLAGVFDLAAALRLVAVRARLIDSLPAGAMLSVFLSEAETVRRLGSGLSLAAVNGPSLCVVAGQAAAVAALEEELRQSRIPTRRLAAGHPFHSAQLEPVVEPLVREAAAAGLRRPALPFVSNVTGRWITAADATDPRYWARHMCRTVRFADGAATLCAGAPRALVEIGPGSALGSVILQAGVPAPPLVVVPSLPHAHDPEPDTATLLAALGRLWLAGVEPGWEAFDGTRPSQPLALAASLRPPSAPPAGG